MIAPDLVTAGFTPPGGGTIVMETRESTVDHDICMSSIQEDEYHLANWPLLEGWAVDIGAHIGAVTVALAVRHPNLRVLAVEIVPENAALLRRNAQLTKVADRVTVVEQAAGGPDEISRTCYMYHRSHPEATAAYVNKHRYIGNSFYSQAAGGAFDSEPVEIRSVSLSTLFHEHGISEVAFMKIDAEGAEWSVLRDPAISRIGYIIGEYHWDYAGQDDDAYKKEGAKPHKRQSTAQAELHALLDATHDVKVADHPTIGHFEAWLRAA